jgi:hypothetical protein
MARPKVLNCAPRSPTIAQLQQGFVTDGMGFGVKLHGSNFKPLMSALGQKQTSRTAIAIYWERY